MVIGCSSSSLPSSPYHVTVTSAGSGSAGSGFDPWPLDDLGDLPPGAAAACVAVGGGARPAGGGGLGLG